MSPDAARGSALARASRIAESPGAQLALCLATVAAVLAVTLTVPEPAHAGWMEDVGSWFDDNLNPVKAIVNVVASILRGIASGLFSLQGDMVGELLKGTVLTDWRNLFGGAGTQIYDFAVTVNRAIIQGPAYTLLGIAYLIQLAKLGSKTSANDTMPMVKDVFMLVVYIVLCKFCIDHAADILHLLYEVSFFVMLQMTGDGVATFATFAVSDDVTDIPALAILLIVAVLGFFVILIAWAVSYIVVWGRALQIYAYLSFSPIPMALMASEETKSIGIGFMKNFLAVCMAGAILTFVFLMFPLVHSVVMADMGEGQVIFDALPGISVLSVVIRTLAIYVLLIFALVKSGAWARDLLGG